MPAQVLCADNSSQNRLWHPQLSLTHRGHLYLLPGSSFSASSPTSKGVHEPLLTLSTLSETRAPHSIYQGAGWVFHFLLGYTDTATPEERGWWGWWVRRAASPRRTLSVPQAAATSPSAPTRAPSAEPLHSRRREATIDLGAFQEADGESQQRKNNSKCPK